MLALVACGIVIAVNLSQIWAKPEVDDSNDGELPEEEEDDIAGLPEVSSSRASHCDSQNGEPKWTY